MSWRMLLVKVLIVSEDIGLNHILDIILYCSFTRLSLLVIKSLIFLDMLSEIVEGKGHLLMLKTVTLIGLKLALALPIQND